jgi:hypothetical protein
MHSSAKFYSSRQWEKETFQSKAKDIINRYKEYNACIELTALNTEDNLDEVSKDFCNALFDRGISEQNIDNILRLIKIELNKISDNDEKWLKETLCGKKVINNE